MNFTILRFDSLDSTNTEAVNQAKRGADEGLCVVARQQTAGRGRHGRSWISEKDAGLYFSIILRPKIEIRLLSLVTLMTAVATAEVLSELYGLKPDIKWVNDIHIGGKKICGILADAVETSKGLSVVVGIGINLKRPPESSELNKISTSVESETNKTPKTEVLLEQLTAKLAHYYKIFNRENGGEIIRQRWIQNSSYAFGKQVRVVLANEIIIGETCGIEINGALRIKQSGGEIKIIQAGDVEMLRKTSPD